MNLLKLGSEILRRGIATLACCAVLASASSPKTQIAATPPMGWNSWDSYGFTIDEGAFRANSKVLERMRPLGWTYAVIDMGWYMSDPFGANLEARGYVFDGFGRLIPDTKRFPSAANGQGFRLLSNALHAKDLKFGIHIMRGIPRQAVRANAPIAGSPYHAADAADTHDTCGWDDGNFGIADNAAGQAYYDSVIALYAKWGVDFVKVDCIADHPYKASEIRQIDAAIKKSGYPILLSLSPGPTQLSHAQEVSQYSRMWRIGNDIWDGWNFAHEHPQDDFPNGVATMFDYLAKWAVYARPGAWPDADMLPLGQLGPHPGWGDQRKSRLTADEARTTFTLWVIARSPLILGGNLTEMDSVTRSLIENRRLIAINQNARASHQLQSLPTRFGNARVWVTEGPQGKPIAMAIFNLGDKPMTIKFAWRELGLKPTSVRDLFTGQRQVNGAVSLRIAPHGVNAFGLN